MRSTIDPHDKVDKSIEIVGRIELDLDPALLARLPDADLGAEGLPELLLQGDDLGRFLRNPLSFPLPSTSDPGLDQVFCSPNGAEESRDPRARKTSQAVDNPDGNFPTSGSEEVPAQMAWWVSPISKKTGAPGQLNRNRPAF